MPGGGQQTDRLEYRTSQTRLQHGYLLGGLLATIGFLILAILGRTIPDSGLIGGIHVLIGGAVIAYTFRLSRDPTPRLVLDSDGVWFKDWGVRAVPWVLIGEVTSMGSRMNTYVCIDLCDSERMLHLIPSGQRQKFRANRLVRLPRLLIPSGTIDAAFDELLSAIRDGTTRFRKN